MAFINIAAILKAQREAARSIVTIVQRVSDTPTYKGNTAIVSGTLTHGQIPSNTTPGVNGQIWYSPAGNLYVCVDAYSANAYYNWKRVQLVNL